MPTQEERKTTQYKVYTGVNPRNPNPIVLSDLTAAINEKEAGSVLIVPASEKAELGGYVKNVCRRQCRTGANPCFSQEIVIINPSKLGVLCYPRHSRSEPAPLRSCIAFTPDLSSR